MSFTKMGSKQREIPTFSNLSSELKLERTFPMILRSSLKKIDEKIDSQEKNDNLQKSRGVRRNSQIRHQQRIEQQNSMEQYQIGKKNFLNFQKHLIRTLRSSIRMTKNCKNDPTIYLALQMWKIFENSSFLSKRSLYFLFGTKYQNQNTHNSNLNSEYAQIASVYPQSQITLAQEYLRSLVSRQCRRLLQENLMQDRRIKEKQKFRKYFLHFVQELEQGWISRRIPKANKMEIMNNRDDHNSEKLS